MQKAVFAAFYPLLKNSLCVNRRWTAAGAPWAGAGTLPHSLQAPCMLNFLSAFVCFLRFFPFFRFWASAARHWQLCVIFIQTHRKANGQSKDLRKPPTASKAHTMRRCRCCHQAQMKQHKKTDTRKSVCFSLRLCGLPIGGTLCAFYYTVGRSFLQVVT